MLSQSFLDANDKFARHIVIHKIKEMQTSTQQIKSGAIALIIEQPGLYLGLPDLCLA